MGSVVARRHPHPGWIYAIQAGSSGPVKIGWASSPKERVGTLQTGHYRKLHVRFTVPGSQGGERYLHELLTGAGLHIRGEWFKGTALRILPDAAAFERVLSNFEEVAA